VSAQRDDLSCSCATTRGDISFTRSGIVQRVRRKRGSTLGDEHARVPSIHKKCFSAGGGEIFGDEPRTQANSRVLYSPRRVPPQNESFKRRTEFLSPRLASCVATPLGTILLSQLRSVQRVEVQRTGGRACQHAPRSTQVAPFVVLSAVGTMLQFSPPLQVAVCELRQSVSSQPFYVLKPPAGSDPPMPIRGPSVRSFAAAGD
jgi:hypothetical protein